MTALVPTASLDEEIINALVGSSTTLTFGVGGAGGEGADSGDVTVNHEGSIVSHGDDSYGIYAQSIAGGGGTAGASYTSRASVAADFVLPLIVGSRDGGTGEAGQVTVNTEGSIVMLGANSRAQHVQAVNGGGGNLDVMLDVSRTRIEQGQVPSGNGDEPGDLFSAIVTAVIEIGSTAVEESFASAIRSEHVGDLIALGDNSPASSTQSVGGGGGSGLVELVTNADTQVDLTLSVGGSDSVASGGGDMDLERRGDVATVGDTSAGSVVHSIGGGGNLIVAILETVGTTGDEGDAEAAFSGSDGAPGKVSFPQQPGAAPVPDYQLVPVKSPVSGIGGIEERPSQVAAAGNALTQPSASVASPLAGTAASGASLSMGSNGSTGNDGGGIDVLFAGDTMTDGALSHGVVLQSIGGGGGAVFTDLDGSAVTLQLSSDNQGSGGDIDFSQAGDVVAMDENAIAVSVQSLGGGGGSLDRVFMGSAGGGGTSGAITVDLNGSAIANGSGGVGVFAQSTASDGQGDIDVTLGEGHFVLGGADGTAVWYSGGDENRFTNFGTVLTTDEASGTAVLADDGSTTIDNFGMIIGDVRLAAGANTFLNNVDAEFGAGAIVDLGGPGSLLQNDGTLIPGFTGRAETVELNGSLLQSETGSTQSEIDFATDSIDQVLATGTVELDGSFDVTLLNVSSIRFGSYWKLMFRGEQGLTDLGLTLNAPESVVLQFRGIEIDGNEALLNYGVDFAAAGLDDNLSAVGRYINRAQDLGGGTDGYGAAITKLVYDPDMATYRQSLSQLSPDFYAEHQVQMINGSNDFAGRLMSCRQSGGEYRFTREGSCMWLQYDAYDTETDRHGDYKATDGSTTRFSLGAQKTWPSDWSFGFGLSRERNTSHGYDDLWSSSGETYFAGLSLKRRFGPVKWSGVLSYGVSDSEARRDGSLLGDFTTTAVRDMEVLSAVLRYSHDVEYDAWYVRPMLDAGLTRLMTDFAREEGGGPVDLVFERHAETHAWLRPAFEVGREIAVGADSDLRVYLNLGARKYLTGSRTDVVARLAEAPVGGVDPMTVGLNLGDPMIGGALGVEFLRSDNFTGQFVYTGNFHDHSEMDSLNLRFQIPLN